jgi:Cu-processing system permease protein
VALYVYSHRQSGDVGGKTLHVHGQERLGPAIRAVGSAVYWLLPNFSAFDLKTEIVYGLEVSAKALLLTQVYGIAYLGALLLLATVAFSRREFL